MLLDLKDIEWCHMVINEIQKKIFNKINENEVIDFFQKSIQIQSITKNEKKFSELIFEKMQDIGFDKLEKFDFKPGRPDIFGITNKTSDSNTLMFVGHTDTVHIKGWKEYWKGTKKEDPFSGALIKNEIWGRGSGDMKAGLLAPLFAIKAIKDSELKIRGNVINILVGDEESGIENSGYSDGIKAIVEKMKNKQIPLADFAIYTEPTTLDIYTAQIGFIIAEITIKGKSAYYGKPWLGIDAIKNANKLMTRLIEYSNTIGNKKRHGLLGRPFNLITEIEGGGYIAVPEESKIKIIRKILPGESVDEVKVEIEDILKQTNMDKGIKTEIKYTASRDHRYGGMPSEISSDLEPVKLLERNIKDITGKKEVVTGSPYWSEASFLIHQLGIPTVYCGAGDITNCHTLNERVKVEELFNSIKIFISMIIDYCGVE